MRTTRLLHLFATACALLPATRAQAAPASAAPRTVLMEEMTTSELKARLDGGCPVALIYSAGTEETGPHVAVGKHIFRVRAYGQAIARNLGDAVLTPILPFAPNLDPFKPFPGTLTLTTETFTAVNEEVARSLVGGGFRRVALMSDHGPSQDALKALAARLDAELASSGARVFYVADGYTRARAEIEAEIKASGRVPAGHGGLWDTSETMAVKPDAVRPERFRAGDVSEDGNGPLNAEGFSGDPRPASAALGRRFGALRVRLAAEEIRRDLAQAGSCR